jgi:addiction module HigA family antidote
MSLAACAFRRWLRAEMVEAHGLTVTEAARHLGVTRLATGNLLNGKGALSPEMAIRFEKAFGIAAATDDAANAGRPRPRPGRTASRRYQG